MFFMLIVSLKEFSNTIKILLFLWISNDCSILRSKTFEEIYFRKIYFPTIRVTAFHLFQLSWTHSSKRAALVWDDCKMPVLLGHEQLSWFFFFFSLKSNPGFIRSTKNWIVASIASRCQKKLQALLKHIMVEKHVIVTIDQKTCKRILICGSECICIPVFRLFCMYQFFFCSSISTIGFLTELKPSEHESGIS